MKKGIAFLGIVVLMIACMGTAKVMAAPSPIAEDTAILADAVTVDKAQGTASELSLERITDANKVIRNIVAEILSEASSANAGVSSKIDSDGTLVLVDEEAPLGTSVEPELLAAFEFTPSAEVAEKLADKGYVEVEFDVESVKKGDDVKVLHYLEDENHWQVITPSSVKDGKVTARFTSFSPIVITKLPESVAKLDTAVNGGLGTAAIISILAVVAVVVAAGAFICTKKFKTVKN